MRWQLGLAACERAAVRAGERLAPSLFSSMLLLRHSLRKGKTQPPPVWSGGCGLRTRAATGARVLTPEDSGYSRANAISIIFHSPLRLFLKRMSHVGRVSGEAQCQECALNLPQAARPAGGGGGERYSGRLLCSAGPQKSPLPELPCRLNTRGGGAGAGTSPQRRARKRGCKLNAQSRVSLHCH